MKSWPEFAAERRRALAEATRAPPAPPPEEVPELQPERRSGSLEAEACQAAPDAMRQMSNMPNVPSSSPRQREVDEVTPFGMFGTFGFRHGAESATGQLIPGALPDPMDLAERAAILEVNGVPREAAEIQALQEAGFPSWEVYAVALAAQLKGKIDAAHAPADGPLVHHWQGLVRHSLSFLASPWWLLACQHGWALSEMFGVHCDAALVRVDGWGLAVAPALSCLPPTRLVELTCKGAVFTTQSGGRLSWPRFCGQRSEQATLWWELAHSNVRVPAPAADPYVEQSRDAPNSRFDDTIPVGEDRSRLGNE
jgi:hypothetical protein